MGFFTFEREYGNERVVVCLNNSPVPREYKIGKPYDVLLWGSARIDSCSVSLDPYGFTVLRKATEEGDSFELYSETPFRLCFVTRREYNIL